MAAPDDQTDGPLAAEDATPPGEALDRVVRIGLLADLYGGLLTERQRKFVELHFGEDYSFGEIARQFSVSRQAVHDAVKHAEAALEDYESKLNLLERGVTIPRRAETAAADGVTATPQAAKSAGLEATPATGATNAARAAAEAASRLGAILDRVRRSGGVIYNAEGLAQELASIQATLAEAAGQGNG